MMRLGWVLVIVWVLMLSQPASAAELIRVLLSQEVAAVHVEADGGLSMMIAGRHGRVTLSAVQVRLAHGKLLINGRPVHAEQVVVQPRTGLLQLGVSGHPRRVTDAAGHSASVSSYPLDGAVRILVKDHGLMVINDVALEDYVKGVVPAEMNARWHLEALKAQAVAARTYALYQRLHNPMREYDVVAGVRDQVYRGRLGVDDHIEQAVDATRGLILAYEGRPILAAFSSTAAGPTEDAMNVWSKELPYLKGVDCPFDANSPFYQWRVELNVEQLVQTLRKQGVPVGTIATVTPFAFSKAGRVTRLRILHSEGELMLRGEDLRRLIGYRAVPSTQFDVEALGQALVLTGRGHGHAVGLCQWGAKELAEHGHSYERILAYYFPGTDLTPLSAVDLSPHP